MNPPAHRPIISAKNHYRGINAHLNSLLQRKDWEEFHTDHISDIRAVLNQKLRGTGYYAKLEKGLQIRFEDYTRHPESDVLILKRDPDSNPGVTRRLAQTERLQAYDVDVVLTPADFEEIEFFPAVTVYHVNDEKAVAWIELLSPSNKQNGGHYREYLDKRQKLLDTQSCVYIEIDYLHRSPPTLRISDYSIGERKATAYHITILDTRPAEETPKPFIGVIPFGVDVPIPVVPIPLAGSDTIELDLQAAYQNTFDRVGYGTMPDQEVDYAAPPVDFYTYMPADQQLITRRMQAVMAAAEKAAEAGQDLDAYLTAQNTALPLDVN